MRIVLPVLALALLPGCWPWIPGSPGEYKEVDDTILFGFLERYDYAGDYWEDGDSNAIAQAVLLDDGEDFRWTDFYGDENGCFDAIGEAGEPLDRADPDLDELTLQTKGHSIDIDWVADSLAFVADSLDGSDVPDYGSRWELVSAMGDDGELRSTTFAQMPEQFEFLEPDLNGSSVEGESLSSDLDIAWTDAKADYYYIAVYNPDSGAQIQCHTTDTDISIDDRMLTRFSPGDIIYVRVFAIIESRSYLPDYDAMSRTHGSQVLVGALVGE